MSRGGRVVQRHVLYLGEINSSQELAWRKSIEVLDDGAARPRTLALFPEDRCEGLRPMSRSCGFSSRDCSCAGRGSGVRAGWRCAVAASWSWISSGPTRLAPSRKGTRWDQVLLVLVAYRLHRPGQRVAVASGVV